MFIPYATDKHQNNSVLYSQNTIQNDATHLRLVIIYMFLMKEGKSDQAAMCIKSRMMTKGVYSVLSINTLKTNVSWLNVCYNHPD